MAIHIREEANRCLQCRKPMCKTGCPVETPIPEIIQLFQENRIMEAGETLFNNNPMSVICAMVCNHEAQCFGHCVLKKKGTPVQFYEIERYLSDTYLDRMRIRSEEKKKERVAIIGSGPVFKTAVFDENGSVIGYEDVLEKVRADSTIIAVSQGPKDRLLLTTEGLKKAENGMLQVDENFMTTVPGVFAAGDVVTGSYTVVSAVRQAKIAAEGIIKWLG